MANKLDAIKSLMRDKPEYGVSWNETTNTINSIRYHGGQTPLTDEQIAAEEIRLTEKEAADKIIYDAQEYARKRKAEYPDIYDYMDGIVKNDQTQIDKYIADAQAVKSKYPKGG
jgi:hypothetical protein